MSGRMFGVGVALLMGVAGCGDLPVPAIPTGVPQAWYGEVADALVEQPAVGTVALLDSGGPCALGDSITVDGRQVSDVSEHGVVRLSGGAPALLCSWYEGTPIDVAVAQAPDDDAYAALVDGAGAEQQSGNVQSAREVVVGARTMQVVRTSYPTNPAAGTDFEAFYLDPSARGRVSLRVYQSDDRSSGYDENAVAADLAVFLDQ